MHSKFTAITDALISEVISTRLPDLHESGSGRGRCGARSCATHFGGAPGGGRVLCEAGTECTHVFRLEMHRARAQPGGGRRPLEAPQGPHAARREALERHGGMGFPPWEFLAWGAPRKGGSRGENQGGGREARPVLTVCRPTCITCPGGRGKSGAIAAAGSISDVAVDDGSTDATHEKKREAKRRVPAPGASDVYSAAAAQ